MQCDHCGEPRKGGGRGKGKGRGTEGEAGREGEEQGVTRDECDFLLFRPCDI